MFGQFMVVSLQLLYTLVTNGEFLVSSKFQYEGTSMKLTAKLTATSIGVASNSRKPTAEPTNEPTGEPADEPSFIPSKARPSFPLTSFPTSKIPTKLPSGIPTKTVQPTTEPIGVPSFEPSNSCTCRYSACDPNSQSNQCCPGMTCQTISGFSMCDENPIFRTASPTPFTGGFVKQCILTGSGYGCEANIHCCNPNAVCIMESCTLVCPTAPTISPRPSAAPVKEPSPRPTKKPSTLPTFVFPTIEPSASPTTIPSSSIPNNSPSVLPSFTASTIPTFGPTVIPSGPSYSPTVVPTIARTLPPSNSPTLKPTANPSQTITAKPSIPLPTIRSTFRPTLSPSFQHETIVSFHTNIDLSSVQINSTLGHIDDASSQAITACVDNSMSLPPLSSSLVSLTPRSNRRLQAGDTTLMDYRAQLITNVPLSLYPSYSQPSDLFPVLSSKLSTSISSGSFSNSLRKMAVVYNAPSISTAVASNSTFHSFQVVVPPTAAPTGSPVIENAVSKLGTLDTVGIIIGALMASFLFVLMVHGLVRYLGQKNKTLHFANVCTANCCCCSHSKGGFKDSKGTAGYSGETKDWVRSNGINRGHIRAQSSFMLNVDRLKKKGLDGGKPVTSPLPSPIKPASATKNMRHDSDLGGPEVFQLNDAELDKWLEEIQDIGSYLDPISAKKEKEVITSTQTTPNRSSSKPPRPVKSPLPPMVLPKVDSVDNDDGSVSSATIRRVLNQVAHIDDDDISMKSNKFDYFLDKARHSYG